MVRMHWRLRTAVLRPMRVLPAFLAVSSGLLFSADGVNAQQDPTATADPRLQSAVALTGVTVVDPGRGIHEPGMTVLMGGSRIRAVFPAGQQELPSGTTVHVVLEEDPSQDVTALRSVVAVMHRGRIHWRETP